MRNYPTSSTQVTHSKDRALSEREFEMLLEGASRLSESNYYYAPDPEFVIYTLGRLGLRRGELCHMKESWIDWREQMISIPMHRDCCCGYCKQLAKQKAELHQIPNDDVIETMWTPKTSAASRDIYFGFDVQKCL